MIKFRMCNKCPYNEAPSLDYKYDFVFINSETLADCIGNESTGQYYIIQNDEIVGSNKNETSNLPFKITLKSDIEKYNLNNFQIVHIGKIKIGKLVKWTQNGKLYEYSIHGIPELFETPIYESENINIWNKYILSLRNKYTWVC